VSFAAAARLLDSLAGGPGPEDLSARLCRAALGALPVTGVGLALMTAQGHGGLVAATDGPATTMEQLQFTLREGPCIDAARSGRPVLEPDLSATPAGTWPGFLAGLAGTDVRAIFAFPLRVGGIRIGVLDIYRDAVGVLTDAELGTALAYADAATLLLLRLQELSRDGRLHPMLDQPWEHRAVVHQATGMVSVQADATIADAFDILAAHSFASGRPIVEVARDVVERRIRLDSGGGTHGAAVQGENGSDRDGGPREERGDS
jgi:hypothetical protein